MTIFLQPKEANKRNCEKCGFAYVINGDESWYMCQLPWRDKPYEGLCMYCKGIPKREFYEKDGRKHLLSHDKTFYMFYNEKVYL